MPTYSTQCSECAKVQSRRLTFAQYDSAKAGDLGLTCDDCGSPATFQFDPGHIGFSMKDGESGGWASKVLKENNYRADRQGVMARRQKDHVRTNKLVPNYAGQEAGSWKDVQDHVRSVKGTEAAATYDPLVKSGN